jgi:AraC-like DNA-binding protein
VTKKNLSLRQRRFFADQPGNEDFVRIRGLGIEDELPICTVDRPNGSGDWLLMCWHDPIRLGPTSEARPANEVMLWQPGAAQWYGTVTHRLRHSWIHLRGKAFAAWIDELGLPTNTPWPISARVVVDRYLAQVAEECSRHSEAEPRLLADLIHALLIELQRLRRGDVKIAAHLRRVRQLLDEDYTRAWSLRALATQAGCSPQHLGRGFHAAFGSSPMAYLARVRMQHAQWLLAEGRHSVSDIATAVGIDDRFCFTRTFRRCFGCSPRAWRTLHRTS